MEPDRINKAPRPDVASDLATQTKRTPPWPTLVRNPARDADEGWDLAAAARREAQVVDAVQAAVGADLVAVGGADADMPPPFCKRFVGWHPNVSLFKPAGVPADKFEWVVLSLDEVEALRLADLNGQYQELAAEQMKISRATFARIVESARRKVADALVHGKALQIQTEPGLQPPPPATAPGVCNRRGCGCKGHGHGRGRFIEYPPKGERK